MDSLCHPWFTTIKLSYGFPILKLPPPPCAVLLVQWYIHIYIYIIYIYEYIAWGNMCPFSITGSGKWGNLDVDSPLPYMPFMTHAPATRETPLRFFTTSLAIKHFKNEQESVYFFASILSSILMVAKQPPVTFVGHYMLPSSVVHVSRGASLFSSGSTQISFDQPGVSPCGWSNTESSYSD